MTWSAIKQKPWIWAWLGTALVWAVIAGLSGFGAGGQVVSAAISFGTFLRHRGARPDVRHHAGAGKCRSFHSYTMTLAGTIAMKFMDGSALLILPGFLIAVGIGLIVGVLNFALIWLLRIPPIIATLSSGLVYNSTAIWWTAA